MQFYERWLERATAAGRRNEFLWTVYGVVIGIVVGFLFGGIGIARAGGAIGVPGVVVGALVLGIIGNRIGVERDRKAASDSTPRKL